MPKAVRRNDAAAEPPATPTAGVAMAVAVPAHHGQLSDWHRRLNWISAGLVLAYKKGLDPVEMRRWREQLKLVDQSFERAMEEMNGKA